MIKINQNIITNPTSKPIKRAKNFAAFFMAVFLWMVRLVDIFFLLNGVTHPPDSFDILGLTCRLVHFFTYPGNMCHHSIIVAFKKLFAPNSFKQFLRRNYSSMVFAEIPKNIKLKRSQ